MWGAWRAGFPGGDGLGGASVDGREPPGLSSDETLPREVPPRAGHCSERLAVGTHRSPRSPMEEIPTGPHFPDRSTSLRETTHSRSHIGTERQGLVPGSCGNATETNILEAQRRGAQDWVSASVVDTQLGLSSAATAVGHTGSQTRAVLSLNKLMQCLQKTAH